jgi:hypothetical protein
MWKMSGVGTEGLREAWLVLEVTYLMGLGWRRDWGTKVSRKVCECKREVMLGPMAVT